MKDAKADFKGYDALSALMANAQIMPGVSTPNIDGWAAARNEMLSNILFKGADVNKEVDKFEAALKKADLKNAK